MFYFQNVFFRIICLFCDGVCFFRNDMFFSECCMFFWNAVCFFRMIFFFGMLYVFFLE